MTIGNLVKETKWIEVVICLAIALIAAATVHRVCVTTCFVFSMIILYYMNTMSQRLSFKAATVNTKKSK